MFRHRGKRRTFYHNLHLASILSFVAGMVNVVSVLALSVFTTNITGHVAYFAEELVDMRYGHALVLLAYSFCFLFGAFISNLLSEYFSRRNPRMTYTFPLLLEIVLIALVVMLMSPKMPYAIELTAGMLLFAMGVQNAMVTKISQSVVRTTHLTGIFTDLGIELSQLFFYKKSKSSRRLKRGIRLKATIVVSFFAGGIIGGMGYPYWGMDVLGLAIVILLLAIGDDFLRYHFYTIKRRWKYRRL